MQQKPNILIFMSDQHTPNCAGFMGDPVMDTPNLDRLAGEGTVFSRAYTSCPLCVPARTSFVTGRLPSRTGVFDNKTTLVWDKPTFLHSLAVTGYETVLCGRMHFVGADQYHGFTKRLVGDFSPLYPRMPGGMDREDLGPYIGTVSTKRCLEVIGGGDSPVLAYDRAVCQAAVDFLTQDQEKPLCLVVGIYGPHFPYVAPPELYKKYRELVKPPAVRSEDLNYDHPCLAWNRKEADEETILKSRAAYYGMVEFMDQQIGGVSRAWEKFLAARGRAGVFFYLSDHGDQIGEREIWGKETFFEDSVKIPLLAIGPGVQKGLVNHSPVSLLDLGLTVCEFAGVEPSPFQDGKSLLPELSGEENLDRCIISEYMDARPDGRVIPSRMAFSRGFKYITYHGFEEQDLLFNLENDPLEKENVTSGYEDIRKFLREKALEGWDAPALAEKYRNRLEERKLIYAYVQAVKPEEKEWWSIPPESCRLPKITN